MFGSKNATESSTVHSRNTPAAWWPPLRASVEIFVRIEDAGISPTAFAISSTRATRITHETIARLHKTWITPFDASDIRGLITALDDVLDLTEAVSERVVLFGIQEAQADAKQLSPGSGEKLRSGRPGHPPASHAQALARDSRPAASRSTVSRTRPTEPTATRSPRSTAPTIRRRAPLDVLKWRDIYDNLEAATDRCEDVANILEGVVLEYS